MTVSEIKDYYNFEDMKNIILERYQELLAYYESFSALNTQQKMQLGAIRQILASEKLLEKATILSTMQEIQKILSDICVRNRIPSHNIVAFGKNIEVDDRVNGISPENFRKMLFESVGLEFIPVEELINEKTKLDCICKAIHSGEVTPSNRYWYAFHKRTLEILSKKTLISYRMDYSASFYPPINSFSYQFDSCYNGFSTDYIFASNVINYPDEALPKRIRFEKEL